VTTGTEGWLDARTARWLEFNDDLAAAASEISTATVVDAGGTVDQVEHDVREWINRGLHRY
jgi:hypothetical protein